MITKAQTDYLADFLALHAPERQSDAMVYEVWQDGEVTLTKGGDLWRKRSLHCIRLGVHHALAFPASRMPVRLGENGSIIVKDNNDAMEAAALVAAHAKEVRDATALPV